MSLPLASEVHLEARWTPPIVLFAALSLAGLGWILTGSKAPMDPLAIGLGMLFEVASVRLAGFGFFSLSACLYLVAARLAVAPVAFAAALGLALRALLRPGRSATESILESLSDLIPLLLLLFALGFSGPDLGFPASMGCALAFLVVWWLIPGLFHGAIDPADLLSWNRCRNLLLSAATGQMAVALWLRLQPDSFWFALPILVALSDSARKVPGQLQAILRSGEISKAGAQVVQARMEVNRARENQESEAARLEVQMESYRLIERMLSSLRQSPSLKMVALAVLEQVRTRVPCSSVALFLESENKLRVVASLTTDQDRVDSIHILGLRESLVERTWQRGRIESLNEEDRNDSQRIFRSDLAAVAAPVSNRGVIYVGNQEAHVHSSQELQYLESLARHSWLALQAAASQEEQQKAYQQELQARQMSEKLLNRLADLVAGMNQLVPLTDLQSLVSAGASLMQRLLKTPTSWVCFNQLQANCLQGPLEGIQELIQTSLKSRRAILHSEIRNSPFYREGSPYESVLVVPLLLHQQSAGFLLAASQRPYEREDQDILTLMALQFGPILETVRLFVDLRAAHEALEQSQAQLIQSSKMAAIGQLAGGVAHELNTPLGAITVSIDSIASCLENRPEKARERLEKTRKACAKMKGIIAKLLFYSRDSANRKESTDLNHVVRDTLDFIGSQIRLENIQLESRTENLPPVSANQNEIQQILINLINNAKDALLASPESPQCIELRTYEEGEACVLQVRDYGPGISEAQAERIFEPFFTTKPVGQGTGLGLSVSLQLAQQNGGSLLLVRHSGPGAMFELRLPQLDPTQED